jgi:uncharacterized protein
LANYKKMPIFALQKNDTMPEFDPQKIIAHTEKWIQTVVVGCNFCPFAAKPLRLKNIAYTVLETADTVSAVAALRQELLRLDATDAIETSFIIFPNDFSDFLTYLAMLEKAEKFLRKADYEGVYQIASFHPAYCFADADPDDAANYTNRSPYPMLHILREASVAEATANYAAPDQIPTQNMAFAQQKGMDFMQLLRAACFVE